MTSKIDGFWVGAYKNPGFWIRSLSRDPLKHITWKPNAKREKEDNLFENLTFGKVKKLLKILVLKFPEKETLVIDSLRSVEKSLNLHAVSERR